MMRAGTRRGLAYCVASYAVGAVVMLWQYHGTQHLYTDPAELFFPVAMPIIWPFYFLYGLASIVIGVGGGDGLSPYKLGDAAAFITMVGAFAVAYIVSFRLLRRHAATSE